jgi:hypothetical protein
MPTEQEQDAEMVKLDATHLKTHRTASSPKKEGSPGFVAEKICSVLTVFVAIPMSFVKGTSLDCSAGFRRGTRPAASAERPWEQNKKLSASPRERFVRTCHAVSIVFVPIWNLAAIPAEIYC